MRLACLDLGSNSLLLTVADWDGQSLQPIHEDVFLIRLSENLHTGGKLHPAARSRCLEALESVRKTITNHGVDKVVAVATEALRRASDSLAFIREIKNRFNLSFRIISPRAEARLTFKAIQKEFSCIETDLVAFDVGGGSTEIISGNTDTVSSVTTLDFGTVSSTEEFIGHDPILRVEMGEATSWIRSRLEALPAGSPSQTGIGVGGTVTTLKAVSLKMEPYDSSVIHGSSLSRSQVDDLLELFLSMATGERARLKGLPSQRADIIPLGAVITGAIMDRLNLGKILVSDRGLRWGILYDWIDRNG
ncbi:MAG: hypothetical protein ACE5HZ_08190 [Fidelibacterota bacterium]